MDVVLMYLFSVLGVAAVIFMLLKKLDIKITLLVVGILLMFGALIIGKLPLESVNDFLAPFTAIVDQFKSTLPKAGLIILILASVAAAASKIAWLLSVEPSFTIINSKSAMLCVRMLLIVLSRASASL